VTRNPNSLPAIRGPPIIPVSRNPNPVTAVVPIIVVIIRGIIITVTDKWRRRRDIYNRRPDKYPEVVVVMASRVSMPG